MRDSSTKRVLWYWNVVGKTDNLPFLADECDATMTYHFGVSSLPRALFTAETRFPTYIVYVIRTILTGSFLSITFYFQLLPERQIDRSFRSHAYFVVASVTRGLNFAFIFARWKKILKINTYVNQRAKRNIVGKNDIGNLTCVNNSGGLKKKNKYWRRIDDYG